MTEIVNEKLTEWQSVIDPSEALKLAVKNGKRLDDRLLVDPALASFTNYFASIMFAARTMQGFNDERSLRNMATQMIMEWENINHEFKKQFQPHA